MAGSEDRLEIRALTEQNEFRDAVQLQKVIWGFDEIDLLPMRLFVVATKIGGQVFGAFDRAKLVAFLLAIPGVKPGGKAEFFIFEKSIFLLTIFSFDFFSTKKSEPAIKPIVPPI